MNNLQRPFYLIAAALLIGFAVGQYNLLLYIAIAFLALAVLFTSYKNK